MPSSRLVEDIGRHFTDHCPHLAIRCSRHGIYELDCDADITHAVEQIVDHLGFVRLRKSRSRRDEDADVVELILDDLGFADRVRALEHRVEPSHEAAVRRHEHVVTAAIDRSHRGKVATAGAGAGVGRRTATITDAIANERHVAVEQARANQLAIGP